MDILFEQLNTASQRQIRGHRQTAQRHTFQLLHVVSQCGEHPAHLMVFSLVQADQRLPLCLRNGRSLCRLALCAVGEPDAGSDGIRIGILPRSCQQDAVILCHVPSGGDD